MFKHGKALLAGVLSVFLVSLLGCNMEPETGNQTSSQGTETTTTSSVKVTEETVINGADLQENAFAYYTKPFSAGDGTAKLSISVEMNVENKSTKPQRIMWQLLQSGYPVIAEKTFETGTSGWITVTGETEADIASDVTLYISTYETDKANVVIKFRNLKLDVTTKTVTSATKVDCLSDTVPSLKETFAKHFDEFGLACEDNELSTAAGQKVLKKHVSTTTMGNEFKPDFIFNWATPNTAGTFTASNGKTIKVPTNTPDFSRQDKILKTCKEAGLRMRGHVLVWHSQTPDWFFYENYKTSGKLVDKDTMTARQEWYISTVLKHVADWEEKNNDGKHIIWAWDVVNEAMADDASGNTYLRGSTSDTKNKAPVNGGSRWYQVYESNEFIINAFRFANKYAPADVKLCYNDYNEYMGEKTNAIIKTLNAIKEHESDAELPTRIDAMGMQSHVGVSWPGVNGYETALKRYLALGLDVHVTEFDISAKNTKESATVYKDYFNMLKKYGNTCTSYNGHKITCVTLWGINDENSWISNSNGTKQYPLLFTRSGSTYYTKDAFWDVIKTAE